MPLERTSKMLQQQAWLAAGVVVAAALASWSGLTWKLDAGYYDRLLASWGYNPGDEVVIVGVDEQSLETIGQWPWPRSTHAALVSHLTRAGVRGVAFDILLSEPGRGDDQGDEALAQAIAANGRTVLPVVPESTRENGPLIESMQVPAIGATTRYLGHTDVELDRDGIARSLYLRAGLGDAAWPALGLALLQLDPQRADSPLPGLRAPKGTQASPYLWHRDHQVLMRYAGPPGSFAQVSYSDVLEDKVDDRLLRGRWVVVGVTTANLSRLFLTPMSSSTRMSGAEYQANVVQMLLGDKAILPMPRAWQAALSAVLAGLIVLLAGITGNRRPWLTIALGVALPLLFSLALLRLGNTWFAPMATITAVLAGHLLWTLAHLRHWRQQASTDPLTGLSNRRSFDQVLAREIANAHRMGAPLSLLLVDVDYFKAYNDSLGHNAGDQALAQIGALLRESARRPRDLAARIGGDEFALILPDTPASGAASLAQRLLSSMRNQVAPYPNLPDQPTLTLSIGGYCSVPSALVTASAFLNNADTALYAVKESGRDGYRVNTASLASDADGPPPTQGTR